MTELEIAKQCAETMLKADRASNALGIEIEVTDVGAARARMTVRDDMVNGLNVCHGGLVFTLADTAFAFASIGHNEQSLASSCQIDFLRPVVLGDLLLATASEDHRGRQSGYYTVKIHNQHDKLVALFRGRSSRTGNEILSA